MSNVRDVRGWYIDADKLITTIDSSDKLDAYSAITVCDLIESELPADAVEVVRCKDCTRQLICYHSDEYYCADGERREDGEIH